jgi:hypothetical protein
MPFDATPVSEHPRRLLALDPSLVAFGAMPQSSEAPGFRPIPAWHSARGAERVGETIGVLARARELISDERRWCRRSFARGWGGIPVSAKSTIAQRFCALGAIMRAAHELDVPAEEARTALEWQSAHPIQDWNDDPARRHAEVMAKFEAAIAALERCAA